MNKVVIIGKGKVGTATGLRIFPEPDYHDPYKNLVVDNIHDYDIAIVCVDTTADGPDDYKDLESVLNKINGFSGLVLLRSTVAPDKIDHWEGLYNISITMFPEFLAQTAAGLDLREPEFVILGGTRENTLKAKSFLIDSKYCLSSNVYFLCSAQEASLIKLTDNAFLSTKVTFFNAIYDICKKNGYDYDAVRTGVLYDKRIGDTHVTVPGPQDGMLGFGGHCLPKDLKVIAEMDDLNLFNSISNINNYLRKQN